ncbi:MAG TPA: hypothetical protein VGL53_03075 [Bryobacteraceae bacterium]|jgi:hypothetical protein
MELIHRRSGDKPTWQSFEESDVAVLLSEVLHGWQLVVKYESIHDIWYESNYLKHDGAVYRYSKTVGCFDVCMPVDENLFIEDRPISGEEATRLLVSWAHQGFEWMLYEE